MYFKPILYRVNKYNQFNKLIKNLSTTNRIAFQIQQLAIIAELLIRTVDLV